MSAPTATLTDGALKLSGDWVLPNEVPEVPQEAVKSVDMTGVTQWDSTLAAHLWVLKTNAAKQNITLELIGQPENMIKLLGLAEAKSSTNLPRPVVEKVGHRRKAALWLEKVIEATGSAISFFGEICIWMGRFFRKQTHFRLQDWLKELDESGLKAMPIITLVSFLVGLIMAFTSSIQLKMFSATIYVADLVAISMTREMGALMTAIVMAGRTGAAYAAQIGSMKRSEELDALRTMGLNPVEMVVLPRVVALTCMIPLLSIFAAFMGILAGVLVSDSLLGVSIYQYIDRTATVPPKNLLIGVVKSVVYGFLVAFAGAWRGMRCADSADGVGKAATSAVVLSITLIIVANAVFAIVLNALKL